jgi:hypothetical protein
MTNQLLTIEMELMSNANVMAGLQLREIKKLMKAEGNAQKKKFANTLALSKVVVNAHAWWTSEDAKAIFSAQGVTWSAEDFAGKVFGWQKSYLYRVLKAGKLEEEKVATFNSLCDQAESEGLTAERTLKGLLKWAKDSETAEANGGDGNESEDGESEASVVRAETLLTLSYKATLMGAERNVAVRISTDGEMISSNTKDEIMQAIAILQASLNQ